MKLGKFHKLMGYTFAGIATVGLLAACSGGNGNASADNGEASSSDSGKFKNEVTLKIPVYDRGVEGIPTVDDNYWTKYVQENFGNEHNIKVEYVPINRQDVMTDYSLLASSKDLPTILMEYDYPKLSQWANEGYLATFDMDDFKKTAPTYFAQMEADGQLDFTQMKGETYFTLGKRPNWDKSFGFQQFYRKDWLKQVGYEEYPTTYADWKDAMTKIQAAGIAEHPGGGTMIPGQGADQPWIFMENPINEKAWASYVSMVIPPLGYEPSYHLLKRENENYNLGITDPEYYLTDAATAEAKFANGETFVYGGYISADMPWLKSFYENNPEAELGVVPVAENDAAGGTTANFRADNPFGMIVGFASTASEEEIQAAWMYMEWMTQEENLKVMQWGVEGENYTVNAETGFPELVADYEGDKKQGFNSNVDYWCIVTADKEIGDLHDMISVKIPKGVPQDFTEEVYQGALRKGELAEEGYAANAPTFTVPIDAESEYSGTLTALYKELRDKLVMAKPEEFDKLYEQYTKQYEDAGYKAVVDERTQAYEDGNSTKLLSNQ